jgi:hypothetical protein
MHTKNSSFKVARSIRRGGMKTSALRTLDGARSIGCLLLALMVVLTFGTGGCAEGHQGDRCVAALSHNDCASSNLTCGPVTDCPETYCCPNDGSPITSAYCMPGCSGGALSIIFASCSTSAPSPLCPCINNINGENLGPLSPDQYPVGVDCTCVAMPDPIACLAMAAEGGMPDAGSTTDGASSESSSTDGPVESSSTDGPVEGSSTDGPVEGSSTDGPTESSSDASGQ